MLQIMMERLRSTTLAGESGCFIISLLYLVDIAIATGGLLIAETHEGTRT